MKIILLSLLLISNISLFAQKSCCDSIKKTAIPKKIFHKALPLKSSKKDQDIIINVDNSNSVINNGKDQFCENSLKTKPLKTKKFDWNDLLKNFISIFLALLAGLFAIYQMKLNIITSARIKWNEDLRDAFSKLYSSSLEAHAAHRNYLTAFNASMPANANQHYSEYINNMSIFNASANKIMMMLNSNEREHKDIEDTISLIDSMLTVSSIRTVTQIDIENELKKIVRNSKVIFKKEWEKSKRLFRI